MSKTLGDKEAHAIDMQMNYYRRASNAFTPTPIKYGNVVVGYKYLTQTGETVYVPLESVYTETIKNCYGATEKIITIGKIPFPGTPCPMMCRSDE